MGLFDHDSLIKIDAARLAEHAGIYRGLAENCRRQITNYERWADDARDAAERHEAMAERFEDALRDRRAADADQFRERADAMPSLPTICGVATGRGLPCTRTVPTEGDRCWQHSGHSGSERQSEVSD